MNLQATMDAFRAEFLTKIPSSASAIVEQATESLAKDFNSRQQLIVGDVAPDFTVR